MFTTMATQLATNSFKKWGWLLQIASHGCDWLHENMFVRSVSLWDVCVFLYIMCMRATIVYVYLCNCTGIFKCEAHFNMIIVPASLWGYEVMGGLYRVRRVCQEGASG